MIKSKDKFELRFIDVALLLFIILGFIAFVNAQEESSTDNSVSETSQEEGQVSDSEQNTETQSDISSSIGSENQVEEGNEVYVDLDEIIDSSIESLQPEPSSENIVAEEIIESVETVEADIIVNNSEQGVDDSNISDVNDTINGSISYLEEDVEENSNEQDYDYVNIDEIAEINYIEDTDNLADLEKTDSEEKNEITFVLYEGNKKEIETTIVEGSNVVINVDSIVVNNSDWKKEVVVYSNKHHENPVVVYADIFESKQDISVFWREEKEYLEYEKFDVNGNGLADRISWIVPHLSEQNFLITLEDTNSTNITNQILINSPTFNSNVTQSTVLLQFFVNSTTGNIPSCNLSLFKSGPLVNNSLFNVNSISYNVSVSAGNYNWNIACVDGNLSNSSTGIFSVSSAQQTQVQFSSNVNQIVKNSLLNVTINISSPDTIQYYAINWGDSSSPSINASVNSYNFNNISSHLFGSTGNYSVTLTTIVGVITYERKLNITVTSPTSTVDNTDPSISLLSPGNGNDVSGSAINFSYSVSDNIKLSNCTLSVYYYQDNSLLGSLFYSKTDNSFGNGTMFVYVNNLLNGDYSWDVGCYDNSTNYDEKNRDFQVISSQNYLTYSEPALNLSAQDQKILDDVDDLIDRINNFITKTESYGINERDALSDLGIESKINNYKKLLLQNRLDITYNLGFIKDSTTRQQRKDEIKEKIAEMQLEIPSDLRVLDNYDYYKTESKDEITQVVNEMLRINGFSVNNPTLDLMVSYVQSLQENSAISNNIKQVSIEYGLFTENIVLVKKQVELKNNSFDFFVERLPSQFSSSKIVFVTNSKPLGNQFFQIQPADLSDGKVVYYLKDNANVKEFEQTGLVLFSDDVLTLKSLAGITGFVSYLGGEGNLAVWPYLLGLFSVFVFLFGGTYYVRQYQVYRLSGKDESFKLVVSKIEGASKLIQLKDFESAKSEYRAIKEKYSSLSDDAKKVVYNKIRSLQIELDRKEAIELVKEFISEIKQGRKEEASIVYSKIKSVYPRLPEEDRKKGYDKIAPYLGMLNSR